MKKFIKMLGLMIFSSSILFFSCTNSANSDDSPTKTPKNVTVMFKPNGHGATEDAKVEVAKNSAIPADKIPAWTDDTYALTGWFAEAACTTAFDLDTPIIDDTTLHAKWEEGFVSITSGGKTTTYLNNKAARDALYKITGSEVPTVKYLKNIRSTDKQGWPNWDPDTEDDCEAATMKTFQRADGGDYIVDLAGHEVYHVRATHEFGGTATITNGRIEFFDSQVGFARVWENGKFLFKDARVIYLYNDGATVTIEDGEYKYLLSISKTEGKGDITIKDGYFEQFYHGQEFNGEPKTAEDGSSLDKGKIILEGGYYKFDPRTLSDYVTIAEGYHVVPCTGVTSPVLGIDCNYQVAKPYKFEFEYELNSRIFVPADGEHPKALWYLGGELYKDEACTTKLQNGDTIALPEDENGDFLARGYSVRTDRYFTSDCIKTLVDKNGKVTNASAVKQVFDTANDKAHDELSADVKLSNIHIYIAALQVNYIEYGESLENADEVKHEIYINSLIHPDFGMWPDEYPYAYLDAACNSAVEYSPIVVPIAVSGKTFKGCYATVGGSEKLYINSEGYFVDDRGDQTSGSIGSAEVNNIPPGTKLIAKWE